MTAKYTPEDVCRFQSSQHPDWRPIGFVCDECGDMCADPYIAADNSVYCEACAVAKCKPEDTNDE